MIICVDFDGTVVEQLPDYDDVTTPLQLKPDVIHGLIELRAAGHILVLWSARLNRALWADWRLDSVWASGVVPFDEREWKANRDVNLARAEQLWRLWREGWDGWPPLRELFHVMHDGSGKPLADLFVDDKALSFGLVTWIELAQTLGEPDASNTNPEVDAQD